MRRHRIEAVILRHLYELRHNTNHLINTVYFPVVNIVMWGFLTIYLTNQQRLQPGLISVLLGGVVLWGFFNGFQRDMGQGFLEESHQPIHVAAECRGIRFRSDLRELDQGHDRVDTGIRDCAALLSLQYLPIADRIRALHCGSDALWPCRGYRDHQPDPPLCIKA
jgi:hypothetical protein